MVTAVYNGERYLEDTITSVLGQRYPNLEYIIVNDGSTDGTADVIRKHEGHLACWINQPNKGLYAALNAGFARSTGDILGWLNSSDKLHTGALFVVGSVFTAFPHVEWITGRPTGYSPDGMTVVVNEPMRWSRYRFLAGANKYIQQESTFWRRSLWERAGGAMNTSFRAEGDFELWVRFFRLTRLYSVDALIAGYRFHSDAMSFVYRAKYNRTCDEIIERELSSVRWARSIRLFRGFTRFAMGVPVLRGLWQRIAINRLHRFRGRDWAPLIQFGEHGWEMRD